jgi:FBD
LISQINNTSGRPLNSAGIWQIDPVFSMSLGIVEFYEFSGTEPEIRTLSFILGSAPLLKKLTIVRYKDTDATEKEAIVEMLKGIPKLSTNLQITFRVNFNF